MTAYNRLLETMRGELQTIQQGGATSFELHVTSKQVPHTLTSEVSIRHHRVLVDEGAEFGGNDLAPNPLELLLAALCASLEVTTRAHALLLTIELQAISVSCQAKSDFKSFYDVPRATGGFTSLAVQVHVKSPATTLEVLFGRVRQCCPVLAALNDAPLQATFTHEKH
jgi:uncharacterized OsmC-like protein